ncbi:hypothetical protein [Streptomyces sp. NPDC101206]|uniref:hypothetical protein n=1 Tax=Streptomyces sp. NPDC101206 TaxID=3366128 RepID=UPI0037FEADF7
MLLALAALTADRALRGVPATWALLGGTVLGMSGLALCKVLLPILLRAHFPARITLFTGVYTTVMALGAAVAVPVAAYAGLPSLGLAVWAVPALPATLVGSFVRAPKAWTTSAAQGSATYVSPWAMARSRLRALVPRTSRSRR